MSTLLILDVDQTIRRTKRGGEFMNDPQDQELMPGLKGILTDYKADGAVIVGCNNNAGVEAKYQTLEDVIEAHRITLSLAPEVSYILFCPDYKGVICYQVSRTGIIRYLRGVKKTQAKDLDPETLQEISKAIWLPGLPSFRKPDIGMFSLAALEHDSNSLTCISIGDRDEDEQAARHINIPFMRTDAWLKMNTEEADDE